MPKCLRSKRPQCTSITPSSLTLDQYGKVMKLSFWILGLYHNKRRNGQRWTLSTNSEPNRNSRLQSESPVVAERIILLLRGASPVVVGFRDRCCGVQHPLLRGATPYVAGIATRCCSELFKMFARLGLLHIDNAASKNDHHRRRPHVVVVVAEFFIV